MIWKKTVKRPIIRILQNNFSDDKHTTLLIYRSGDEYITSMALAVKEAAKHAGYDLKILDSKNSAGVQLNQVKAASENGGNSIIVNLVDPYDAPNILEAAGDMKVIFINRIPSDMSLLNENAIYVGSDNNVAGRMQGEWLVDYFNFKRKNDIKYILLEGTPGLPTTIQRTSSALQALSDGGINATEAALPIIANFSRDEALYKIFPILISDIKFDTIISNNDEMALGAIDALEALDMDPAETPIVGVDAIYAALKAIKEGTLAMTVFQNAKAQGETSITALTNMLNGDPIDRGTGYNVSPDNPYAIYIPFEPVTINHIPQDIEYVGPIT
ncbi:MAG: substrate-binding domain-containing protein [Clostridia bacterium]|jgi:ABC-type sugar transport system substrate-binding protein|nr:substrate-binding domain-containing protein [Clostridia bacterium]MCI2015329.1 substrate-binding domain-containing protein [Clostridia bacterium]